MSKAQDIILKIFDSLGDRGGFDHWWDDLDEDIQTEILEDLEVECSAILDSKDVGEG